MLTTGEIIKSPSRSYRVTWASSTASQAEVGYALDPSTGKEYFIKRLIKVRYPLPSSLGSPGAKEERRRRCEEWFSAKTKVYYALRSACNRDVALPVEEFFRDGPFYYTVYEKINPDGLTVSRISALPDSVKLQVLKKLAEAVKSVHAAGLVHGDLKPDNIIVSTGHDGVSLKLIDMDDCYFSSFPELPENVIGTPEYYSPEIVEYISNQAEDREDKAQLAKEAALASKLTPASDIFSLGIIFHEYLTGDKPTGKEEGFRIAVKEPYLAELLTSMLADSPSSRPDINTVLIRLDGRAVPAKSVVKTHIKPSFTPPSSSKSVMHSMKVPVKELSPSRSRLMTKCIAFMKKFDSDCA